MREMARFLCMVVFSRIISGLILARIHEPYTGINAYVNKNLYPGGRLASILQEPGVEVPPTTKQKFASQKLCKFFSCDVKKMLDV
jgi:hypothetical protein